MNERVRRAQAALAVAAVTAGLGIPVATARAADPAGPAAEKRSAAAFAEGDELVAPGPTTPAPDQPSSQPQTAKPRSDEQREDGRKDAEGRRDDEKATAEADATADADGGDKIPTPTASACTPSGVPADLIPIYEAASERYGLGAQGPAILAAINAIETNFGTNLGPSSAGAVGWMQFMPATWSEYGVDADGDGVANPDTPEDAIFAAASYLRAAGMPDDVDAAIFAYNHADWYVADVLARAGCYAQELGEEDVSAGLGPQIQVLRCEPASGWSRQVPAAYLEAFEDAAGRYQLGRRGVWAMAAIARLESSFGRGINARQLRSEGALGLDAGEWKRYAVDGDRDGRIGRADIDDAAATLARLIWSHGDLRAGVFAHNQAEWYVQQVMDGAERIGGACVVAQADWRLAPLGTGTGTEVAGARAQLGADGLASAPRAAPPAVKAAIAAANSIADTPYIWGGGHGSWASSGYDCSGAVSFALHAAGLLDTPLTSGALESYGEAGPGRWITIYANATHTYVEIAGLRFDTAGNPAGVSGPRWKSYAADYGGEFVVRHPAGY